MTKTTQTSTCPQKKWLIPAGAAAIISLILLSAYQWHRIQIQQVQIQATQQLTQSTQRQVNQVSGAFIEQLRQQDQEQAKLQEQIDYLQRLANHDFRVDVWEELLLLVRMSYYDLIFRQDKTGATQWLNTALEFVQLKDQPTMIALELDINQLRQEIDNTHVQPIRETSALLSQLANAIDQWHPERIQLSEPDRPEWQGDQWRDMARFMLEWLQYQLQKLIHVQTLETPMPLSNPRQFADHRFALRTHIAIAQWAALHQDQSVYNESLTTIKQLCETLQITNPNIIETIAQAQAQIVAPTLPDYHPLLLKIHQNQAQANQAFQQQLRLSVEQPTPPPAPDSE